MKERNKETLITINSSLDSNTILLPNSAAWSEKIVSKWRMLLQSY